MKINYSYLQPPRAAYKQKRLKEDQFEVIDQKPLRKIFQKVKYTIQQQQKLHSLKKYLHQKNPSIQYSQALLLKMIYLSRDAFNPINTSECIHKHQSWFQDSMIVGLRDQGRKILEEGVFYQYGRDQQYAPVIYVFPAQLDFNKFGIKDYYNAWNLIMQPVEEFMLIPGVNQTINLVIDMENKQFALSMNAVREMIEKVVFAYPYRLKRLFFVNIKQNSQLPKCIKEVLRNFNYQAKVQFITKMDEFRRYISDEQREKKYGGSLADLNQYWPISLAMKYQEEKSYFLVDNTSETDYKSVMNDDILFESNQISSSLCGNFCGEKSCSIY